MPLPPEHGRRLAVCCDVCGTIIQPGQKFMPVRGLSGARSCNRDICAGCVDAVAEGESVHTSPDVPKLLSEHWRPRFSTQ